MQVEDFNIHENNTDKKMCLLYVLEQERAYHASKPLITSDAWYLQLNFKPKRKAGSDGQVDYVPG